MVAVGEPHTDADRITYGSSDPDAAVSAAVLHDTDTHPDGNSHTCAYGGAHAQTSADRIPDTRGDGEPDRNSGVNADTDSDANADPERSESESRTRRRRFARLERDDRFGGVDLASLSELNV